MWMGYQWTYKMGSFIEYTSIIADTVYVNIIDNNILSQVGMSTLNKVLDQTL